MITIHESELVSSFSSLSPVMNWRGSIKLRMILLIFIHLSSMALGQDNPYNCTTAASNFTSNSADLTALLRSLSSNITDYGFHTASVGAANGLALCRADQSPHMCRACIQSASRELLESCPGARQAVIWYEYCTLRYSNDPIHNTRVADPVKRLRNTQNAANGNAFKEDRARLLADLTARAANGTFQLKVGAGARNLTRSDFATIYGLVQCTPDFSSEDCRRCLTEIAEILRNYTSIGFRVLGPDCVIRYEVVDFYNETRLGELGVKLVASQSTPPATSQPGINGDNTILGKKDDNKTKVMIFIAVPVGATLIFAGCAIIIFIRRRMKRSGAYEIAKTAEDISNVESQQYDFSSIRAATNDFSNANKLGQGGFGAVYKGKLQTGEEIAVKRLSKDSGQGNMEFKNEVLLVANLQHRNLVKLLGFSMEGTERVVIYEFVENASLDQFIFDPVKRSQLDWDKRYKIIGGIAKGLLYLHEDSRLKIIHRDLKASNVLLDGDMNPKIADFGMARLFKQDETQGNTRKIVGTYGYMSPEYAMHGKYSDKSDVFSFGVLVLEILSGQRNVCIQKEENGESLLTFTWKKWREGTAANVIDPVLRNGAGSERDIVRCIHIGLLCVQENASKRPTMASVAVMLSSTTMSLTVPSQPAFYLSCRYRPQDSKDSYSSEVGSGVSQGTSSVNDVSVTEIYPQLTLLLLSIGREFESPAVVMYPVRMILVIIIYLSSRARAQENPFRCTSNGSYRNNSVYSANLNALLLSLSTNMSDYGFHGTSVGAVNGLALCRADQTLEQCRTCVESASREVLQSCPSARQAVIWYEHCSLRYSNDPIHNTQTEDPTYLLRDAQNASNGDAFKEDRARLLSDLMAQAANGTFELKVGAGARDLSHSDVATIYALVQCTPDFSSEDCRRCLAGHSQFLQSYISIGIRVLGPNCIIWYEDIGFYNETRLRELGVQIVASHPPETNGNNTILIHGKKDDNTAKVIIFIAVPAGATLLFAACAIIIFIRRRTKRSSAYKIAESADDICNVESLQYDFRSIRVATNDFADANKLGQGGFGAVYKGKLQTGQEIAVKRLSKDSTQGNVEFKNEVSLVAKLQHRNLVKLLGFSMEGTERVLIYEFVPNASLDKFIFDPVKSLQLDWNRRYMILRGVAKGLLYLHEDSRLRIIHRDLKASNILLDGDMNPNIADFGMARLFKQDETQGNTSKIAGTYGYMSPEYAMHGMYSNKSDVYSFGVLVLEILSGQRSACIKNEENGEDLLAITWKKWSEGTAADMIDPVVRNGTGSERDMVRCIHIGLLCVQENATMRPTMASVGQMLGRTKMSLPVPSEPAFYLSSHYGPVDSYSSEVRTGVSQGSSSVNDVSITELCPR
ncbi:uncharacterized protein LOC121790392 [Salvia splendens]|uniref:uncharacterized protein LOC121790392 n=1 Tax=Salvia splendens TaxID=180675 RepID=UPI001C269C71|nr:uncharacterized protein LOC121790392 [Salvia splendens]